MKVKRSKPRVRQSNNTFRYVVSLTGAPSVFVERRKAATKSSLVAEYRRVIKIQSTEGTFKVRQVKPHERIKVNAHNIVLGTMPSIMPAFDAQTEEFGDDED